MGIGLILLFCFLLFTGYGKNGGLSNFHPLFYELFGIVCIFRK